MQIWLALWFIGLLLSIEIKSRVVDGRSFFTKLRECAAVELPFVINDGWYGTKLCTIYALFAWGIIPIGWLIFSNIELVGLFVAAFSFFFILIAAVLIPTLNRPQLVTINRTNFSVTPMTINGRLLSQKKLDFTKDKVTKIVVLTSGSGGAHSTRTRILLSDENGEKISFKPPPAYFPQSFAMKLGTALQLPVYIERTLTKPFLLQTPTS